MRIYVTVITLFFCFVICTSGCKDSPTDSKNPDYTITLIPKDSETGDTLSQATVYNNETNDTIGTGVTAITQKEDSKLKIRVEASGYMSAKKTLIFLENKKTPIELSNKLPKNIKVNYRIVNKSNKTIKTANLFIADTLAGGPNGTITLAYSNQDSVSLCPHAKFYTKTCRNILPNRDYDLELLINHKTVNITVIPKILGFYGDTDSLVFTDNGYYVNRSFSRRYFDEEYINKYLARAGFQIAFGDSTLQDTLKSSQTDIKPFEITYPMGEKSVKLKAQSIFRLCSSAADREIYPDIVDCGENFGIGTLLDLSYGKKTIVPDRDQEISLELTHVPACLDGIDNDFDHVADSKESGCVNSYKSTSYMPGTSGWVYEPKDDDEILWTVAVTGYGGKSDVNTFVSSKKGERRVALYGQNLYSSKLQRSIKHAIGDIRIYVDNKLDKSQSGEAFALELRCKDKNSDVPFEDLDYIITDIVPDDESVDGWRETFVKGITNRFFVKNGLKCAVWAQHATKVNGEKPGNGNDDVFFYEIGRDMSNKFDWFVELEDIDDGMQMMMKKNSTKNNVTIQKVSPKLNNRRQY